MGESTGIAWCDHTFNPWIGCTKVSPGCENCYAERQNKFYNWNPAGWGKGHSRHLTSDENWKKPIQWAKQAVKDGVTRRVFCASLADVFDDEVPKEWRDRLFGLISLTSKFWSSDKAGLEWLILTKRPENISEMLPMGWSTNYNEFIRIGVTCENQEMFDIRFFELYQNWNGKNFISIEPMLSEFDDVVDYLPGINWLICGCESGSNARPMNIEWARSLRDQCVEAGAPFFLKQMMVDGKLVVLPELDGRKWAEFPVEEK